MKRLLIALASTFIAFYGNSQSGISIIPQPNTLTPGTGTFASNATTTIYFDPAFETEAQLLKQWFPKSKLVQSSKSDDATNAIVLKLIYTIRADNGYSLLINPKQIKITASSSEGVFYALQSLRQLLPSTIENKPGGSYKIPAVSIQDAPQYNWRGLHLDVSRHFFAMDYLYKLVDRMSLYKFNKLHLHLTDDQGWRIEIKKYPLLTSQGAWRSLNNQDSGCMKLAKDNPDFTIDPRFIKNKEGKTSYGGFYTQVEMKAFVAYAAKKHIDIIPEIDMPGHMMAAIHAYPYLSCSGGSTWGELFSTPICPGKESTYQFAQDVFSEIMDIFPSEYIHLGADEVDQKAWANSPDCQELMKREGIKTLPELQSYFVRRMEQFFISKGRKLIGWDEILEGGVTPTANVMYWRSWVPDAPIHAAKLGNKVIMSPGNPLYFDNAPDPQSLYNIYHFDVVPKALTAEEGKAIIGAQANLWSEYVPSEARADYLYFPRMISLSERLWSANRDYASFQQRLATQFGRLDNMGVKYRLPDVLIPAESLVFVDSAKLQIKTPAPGLTIRFTTDGSIPNKTSKLLPATYVVKKEQVVKLAAFNANGRKGDVYTLTYKKQSLATSIEASAKKGLKVDYFKKFYKTVTVLPNEKPDSSFVVAGITVPSYVNAPSFGLVYQGTITVPESGIYTFYFTCDDGGILTIANRLVVDNDGLHAPKEKSGQIALAKGAHPFNLAFIEGGGGYTLKLKYSFNGGEAKEVPESWFGKN